MLTGCVKSKQVFFLPLLVIILRKVPSRPALKNFLACTVPHLSQLKLPATDETLQTLPHLKSTRHTYAGIQEKNPLNLLLSPKSSIKNGLEAVGKML